MLSGRSSNQQAWLPDVFAGRAGILSTKRSLREASMSRSSRRVAASFAKACATWPFGVMISDTSAVSPFGSMRTVCPTATELRSMRPYSLGNHRPVGILAVDQLDGEIKLGKAERLICLAPGRFSTLTSSGSGSDTTAYCRRGKRGCRLRVWTLSAMKMHVFQTELFGGRRRYASTMALNLSSL